MEQENDKKVCPNCQLPALWDGTKLVCEPCDVTFVLKPGGGARVAQVGRVESLENRMDQVEKAIGAVEPAEPEPVVEGQEPEPAVEDQDKDQEVWP